MEWESENVKIEPKSTKLPFLFIRENHRAHSFVECGKMMTIHHTANFHDSFAQNENSGRRTSPIFGHVLPVRKESPNTEIRWSPDEALWVAATGRDE